MSEKPQGRSRWEHLLAFGLLAAVLRAVYFAHTPLLPNGFWGSDDWSHIHQAVLVSQGQILDAFQLRLNIYVGAGQAALRQVATLVWGLDFALFGLDARAYYRTNLLLHLLLSAGVWALARQAGLRAMSAALAAVVFGLQAETAETIWFLASRSEQLALVFALAAVGLWPRLRGSSWGAAGAGLLWALALFSKTTAAWLPLVLLWRDVLELPRGERLRPAALLRRGWGLVAAGALYGLAMLLLLDVGNTLSYGPDGGGGGEAWSLQTWARAVFGGLLTPGWQPGPVQAPSTLGWTRAGALAGALFVGGIAAWRSERHRRPLLLGCGLLVAGLILPAPLVGRGMDAGRYLIPASAGLALAAAVAVDALHPWVSRLAASALSAVLVVAFLNPGPQSFRSPPAPGLEAIVRSARALPDEDRRHLKIALPHPDPPHLRMLARQELLQALVPGVESVQLLLEGDRRLWSAGKSDDPTYMADCGELLPGRGGWDDGRILYEAGNRWLPAAPKPPPRAEGAVVRSWEFSSPEGRTGWGVGPLALGLRNRRPPQPQSEPTQPLRVRGGRPFSAGQLRSVDPRGMDAARADSLGLVPGDYCGMRVTLQVPRATPRPPRCAPIEPAAFAVLAWGVPQRDGLGPHLVLPLAAEGEIESVEVSLTASPSWQAAERIDRLALLPSNLGGEAFVHSIDLMGCD